MSDTIFVGDKGTEILLDTLEDITTATSVAIRVVKPDATVVSWTGAVSATTKVRYVTSLVTSDFDQSGTWILQAYVVMPSWIGYGEEVELEVSPLQG
jgi:hypothetical protein